MSLSRKCCLQISAKQETSISIKLGRGTDKKMVKYYIHLHSQWVGVHVKNMIYKSYQTPLIGFLLSICSCRDGLVKLSSVATISSQLQWMHSISALTLTIHYPALASSNLTSSVSGQMKVKGYLRTSTLWVVWAECIYFRRPFWKGKWIHQDVSLKLS